MLVSSVLKADQKLEYVRIASLNPVKMTKFYFEVSQLFRCAKNLHPRIQTNFCFKNLRTHMSCRHVEFHCL